MDVKRNSVFYTSGESKSIREKPPLVTDELVRLQNQRLKFRTSGNLTIILEEFKEYSSN